jgi:hypothetical protein
MIEGTGRTKYAAEMVFDGMMHKRIGARVQMLLREYTYRHTDKKVIS